MYPYSTQFQNIQFVNGTDFIDQYHVYPNNKVLFMDKNKSVFYMKEADHNGICTLRTFEFHEVAENKNEYITKQEFDEWRKAYESLISKYGSDEVHDGDDTSEGESTTGADA